MIEVNSASTLVSDIAGFQTKVNELDAHDLSYVKDRLRTQHLWRSDATEKARQDFVRFASLTMLKVDESIVPTVEVDEFWHSFLLFTHEYMEWGHRYWGKDFFFHHVPGHKSDGSWEKTQALMKDIFGVTWVDALQARSCYTPPPQTPPSCWTANRILTVQRQVP